MIALVAALVLSGIPPGLGRACREGGSPEEVFRRAGFPDVVQYDIRTEETSRAWIYEDRGRRAVWVRFNRGVKDGSWRVVECRQCRPMSVCRPFPERKP